MSHARVAFSMTAISSRPQCSNAAAASYTRSTAAASRAAAS